MSDDVVVSVDSTPIIIAIPTSTITVEAGGTPGPPGEDGPPTTLYVQPDPPNLGTPPGGFPLWLDTDDVPPPVMQVTHPNVDDVLVQTWDAGKGRWQRSRYDSGWRRIPFTAGSANWTAGEMLLRREGSLVTAQMALVKVAALSSFYTFPSGFQPTAGALQIMAAREEYETGSVVSVAMTTAAGTYWWLPMGHSPAVHGFTGSATWSTDDPIPASLPGLLVSQAPA